LRKVGGDLAMNQEKELVATSFAMPLLDRSIMVLFFIKWIAIKGLESRGRISIIIRTKDPHCPFPEVLRQLLHPTEDSHIFLPYLFKIAVWKKKSQLKISADG
jgi:hypothetical protein